MNDPEHILYGSVRSYASLEDVDRLKVDYAIFEVEGERRKLLLARVFDVLRDEERRLCKLTDDEVHKDLETRTAIGLRNHLSIVSANEDSKITE